MVAELNQIQSSNFEEMFEHMNAFFNLNKIIEKEIISAKKEFFLNTGLINEDDAGFSIRMNAFLLWFIFDWDLAEHRIKPFELYLDFLYKNNKTDEFELMKKQKNHIHSLFKFIKIADDITLIKDIFSGVKYRISDNYSLIGCAKKTFFETRIFLFENQYFFANYFIQHPFASQKGIRKKIKQIKKEKSPIKPFLLELHSSYTKWSKYRNISIKSIYHFDNSIPEAK